MAVVLLRKLRTLMRMSWHQRVRRISILIWTPIVFTATYIVGFMIAAAGYRFLPNTVINKGAFGNLVLLPQYYVKAISVGLLARRKWIMLAPSKQTPNRAVVGYWRRHFRVIESDLVCRLAAPLSRMPFVSERSRPWPQWRISIDGHLVENRQASYEVVRRFEEEQNGNALLELSR